MSSLRELTGPLRLKLAPDWIREMAGRCVRERGQRSGLAGGYLANQTGQAFLTCTVSRSEQPDPRRWLLTTSRVSCLFSIQLPLNVIGSGVAAALTVCHQASMRHHIRCDEVIPTPVRSIKMEAAALLRSNHTRLEMSPTVENVHFPAAADACRPFALITTNSSPSRGSA